jgi:hypothetical protein
MDLDFRWRFDTQSSPYNTQPRQRSNFQTIFILTPGCGSSAAPICSFSRPYPIFHLHVNPLFCTRLP